MSEPLPSGPLLWGQAGEYDAIDDRLVITTLAAGTIGLVRPPTLAPGAGLLVNVGRWHGLADCGDGTLAAAGTRDTQSIEVPAGGGSPRTDVLFADVDPDAGTWQADLYTEAEAATRAGLRLGTILVPAGANSSAQFDLTPATVALARVRGVYATTPDVYAAALPLRELANLPPLEVQADRTYHFRFQANTTTGVATTIGGYLLIGGTAEVPEMHAVIAWHGPATPPMQVIKRQQQWGNDAGLNSGTWIAGASYICEIEGYFRVVRDGTARMFGRISANATAGMTVQPGATLLLTDITGGPVPFAAAAEPGEPGRIIR